MVGSQQLAPQFDRLYFLDFRQIHVHVFHIISGPWNPDQRDRPTKMEAIFKSFY